MKQKLRDQETGIAVVATLIAAIFGYPLAAGYAAYLMGMSPEVAILAFVVLPIFLIAAAVVMT